MASSAEKPFKICIAEDRPYCEPAVRLLLQSLARAEPGCTVVLFCPFADEDFVRFAATLPEVSVDVRTVSPPGAYLWNVKPQALLELLNEGAGEVVWIDSDIIVISCFIHRFSALDNNAIVVAEEALSGRADDNNALRAKLWGFRARRRFSFTLNSAILRVTRKHVPLLQCWHSLLTSQVYRDEQAKELYNRRVNMVGDQDVLMALLCSQEFYDIPVNILRKGSDIIQYLGPYGFTTAERLWCLICGLPPFVHSQGVKAWIPTKKQGSRSLRESIIDAYLDASPYTVLAAGLWPIETGSWTRPRTRMGAALRTIGFGNPALTGFPVAVAVDIVRLAKGLRRAVFVREWRLFWTGMTKGGRSGLEAIPAPGRGVRLVTINELTKDKDRLEAPGDSDHAEIRCRPRHAPFWQDRARGP